jgi:hypothetical protein
MRGELKSTLVILLQSYGTNIDESDYRKRRRRYSSSKPQLQLKLGKRITGVKNVVEAGAVTEIVVAADHESTEIEADQMNVDIGHTTAVDLL